MGNGCIQSSITPPPIHPQKPLNESSEDKGCCKSTSSSAPHSNIPAPTQVVLAALNNHFILKALDHHSKQLLISRMKSFLLGPFQTVIQQDSPVSHFFVLASGRLELLINGTRREILRPGNAFGELALLEGQSRGVTIKTIENSTLWGLDQEAFRTALRKLNESHAGENREFIEGLALAEHLNEQQKDALAAALVTQNWEPGQCIVREGDAGQLFYLIKEGSVLCSEKGKELLELSCGDYFGELALLSSSVRTATVTALTEVTVLSVKKEDLHSALGRSLEYVIYRNVQRMALGKATNLKILSKAQVETVINSMEITIFADREVIIPRGELKNNLICIVLKGLVVGECGAHRVLECIGDDYLGNSTDEHYHTEHTAASEVTVARITRGALEFALGGEFRAIAALSELLSYLRKVQIFSQLGEDQLRALAQQMTTIEFPQDEVIVRENTAGSAFFIVKQGSAEVMSSSQFVREIRESDYFGERSLLFDEPRGATVTVKEALKCWVLKKKAFCKVLDEAARRQLVQRTQLQDNSVLLGQLVPIRTIGRSRFGNVYLVAHTGTKSRYALKTFLKEKVVNCQFWGQLAQERQILLQLDHLLIVKLVRTFKDAQRLYMLQEYVNGVDLFEVLQLYKTINEDGAKFYAACLVLILEHLHQRDIVYRDLKPENIIIDEEGYPKLMDFSTAKVLRGRSYTTVGTPHYMAPEIILGKGYGLSADWWSLGVVLYECLYGGLPFGTEDDEPQAVYERILGRRVVCPALPGHTLPVRSLLQQLLSKNPNARAGQSVTRLKSHRWFSSFNWAGVLKKQATPFYRLEINSLEGSMNGPLRVHEDLGEFIVKEETGQSGISKKPPPKGLVPPHDWDAQF